MITSEDVAPLVTGAWLELDFARVSFEDLFNTAMKVLEDE